MDENIKNEEFETEINKEETRKCRYCGRELNTNFDFCIYCGKNQSDMPVEIKPAEEKKKAAPVIKARKKNIKDIVLFVLSVSSFAIALIFFALAVINWAGTALISSGSVFGNLFGSVDVSAYIISFINITALFFSSVIFMLAGIALQMFRK